MNLTTIMHPILFKIKSLILRTFYFKLEQQLLSGKAKKSSQLAPVALFTTHKAASSILSVRLSRLMSENDYQIADLSSYFAKVDPTERSRFLNDSYWSNKVFAVPGVFHTAFRYPTLQVPVPPLKIILVLRDPRDVLVSYYFSFKFSHPIQNEFAKNLHDDATRLSIDEFVLQHADDFLQRYNSYENWIGKPNVLFFRYEDLIAQPKEIETQLFDFIGIGSSQMTLFDEDDFSVTEENPAHHKRKVIAGDHREKLQSQTIIALNKMFESHIRQLNYAL
jgi:hypothetical protein